MGLGPILLLELAWVNLAAVLTLVAELSPLVPISLVVMGLSEMVFQLVPEAAFHNLLLEEVQWLAP